MPETTYDSTMGPVRAYVAEPDTRPPWPGAVVLHESFGLTDDIRAKADRFASRGYVALAPDLYSNRPPGLCVLAAFRSLLSGRGPHFDAIDAARAQLAGRADCTGHVGVIGFCMGGGFALLSARRFDFAAAAVNYARLPHGDVAAALRGACPVVASYGGRDRTLRGTATKLERALTEAAVEHDVEEYPDASHSFLNQHSGPVHTAIDRITGIGHHGPSAQKAWRRIDAFFDRHVAG